MTRRLSDWPDRLKAFVESKRNCPFAWGSNDCCLFAADEVLAITGEDLAQEYRGRYDSALGAARLLKEVGGIEELTSTKLEMIPVGWATRGDVAAMDLGEHGVGLCVVIDERVVAPAPNGIVFLPLSAATIAWKV